MSNVSFKQALGALFAENPPEDPGIPPALSIKKQRVPRTLEDAALYTEAQRLYNPGQPNSPKAPPAKMVDQGSGTSMDMTGRWGTPGSN